MYAQESVADRIQTDVLNKEYAAGRVSKERPVLHIFMHPGVYRDILMMRGAVTSATYELIDRKTIRGHKVFTCADLPEGTWGVYQYE